MMRRILALVSMFIITTAIGFAEEENAKKKDTPEFKAEFPKELISDTKHTIRIDGKPVEYTATAGNILLKEENGRPKASIFFMAYARTGMSDPSKRAITFSFNGGPGSSSVWLHLGVLGPRRVQMPEEGFPPKLPYQLVDNDYSVLDQTDLVFIDPVTTGYSRAVPGEDPKQFHGYREDAETVGEFIRLYVSRFRRWSSPKFLIGESYGTTRAAALSLYLQQRHGMYLNGVILVSSILNFQTARFNSGNDLPYILFLPTYTATAWYHKKLVPELQNDLRKTLDEVRQFAVGEYTLALMKGSKLSPSERNTVAEKLARYTGLTTDYVNRSNLRIEIFRFTKELMRAERLTVGRLDSRFTGRDRDAAGEEFEFDPSYAAIEGVYTAALNHYVRMELKYESDLAYEILTDRVRPWSYLEYQNEYVDVSENLRQAISLNPAMKVLVANGYYDLATPFFATEYTFQRLPLEQEQQKNITMTYYEAGHMMYIHKPSLIRMKADLAAFYDSAL
ncbi:peptidase S10 [bacterium]|nr:peptidase S10 [bacterium]